MYYPALLTLLYWDKYIIIDKYIVANKPNIVLLDRVARRDVIVDIATLHDDNLVKKKNDLNIDWGCRSASWGVQAYD